MSSLQHPIIATQNSCIGIPITKISEIIMKHGISLLLVLLHIL